MKKSIDILIEPTTKNTYWLKNISIGLTLKKLQLFVATF